MRRTMLNTPFLTASLRPLASLILWVMGWRIDGSAPPNRKYVLVAAPHTSNLDGFLLVVMACRLRLNLFWLGKKSLFRFPFGPIVRWFGGIAVDRSQPNGLVQSTSELFSQQEDLIITIPPEGTRSKTAAWKTGFYYIALAASVPIALGYLDYRSKRGGIGPMVQPSGEIELDLKEIGSFYDDKIGRFADRFGDIRLTEGQR